MIESQEVALAKQLRDYVRLWWTKNCVSTKVTFRMKKKDWSGPRTQTRSTGSMCYTAVYNSIVAHMHIMLSIIKVAAAAQPTIAQNDIEMAHS